MKKEILLSSRAQKDFEKLHTIVKERIRTALFALAAGAEHSDIKKLKGVSGREDLYRLRVGEYRIIYYSESDSIKIIRIEHRSKAYEWLE
ncbi:MAG: type II toxin-antitoxin system RelE/ParE family toxin [Thermoplasmata archaeon]